MVEFALVVPVFLALVFGIISYGYMLSYRQAVSQSAAEGARAFAVAPSGVTEGARRTTARAAINESLTSYGITCTTAGTLQKDGQTVGTCSLPAISACPSDASRRCATVVVTHNYRDNPLIPSFPGLGITLPEKLTYTAVVEVAS